MKRYSFNLILTTVLAVSLYVIFSGFSYRPEYKLGYINSNRLFEESLLFQNAQSDIEQERIQLQQDLQVKQDNLEKRLQDYQNQQLLMSEKRKEETQQEPY